MSSQFVQPSPGGVVYDRNGVTVDDRFLRIGAKSYAINKITSLDVRTSTVPGTDGKRPAWWALAVAAAVVAILKEAHWLLIVTAIFGLLGWQSQPSPAVTSYQLFLVTNAGEAQAHMTNDEAEHLALRRAIEDAMARSA